jgi:hypothetical protein
MFGGCSGFQVRRTKENYIGHPSTDRLPLALLTPAVLATCGLKYFVITDGLTFFLHPVLCHCQVGMDPTLTDGSYGEPMESKMTDTLIGYVVIGGSPLAFGTRMVSSMEAAKRLARGWDRKVRRYFGPGTGYDAHIAAVRRSEDGRCYVTAGGDESGTGLAGMGLAGSYSVKQAKEWLEARPERWLRKHKIIIAG